MNGRELPLEVAEWLRTLPESDRAAALAAWDRTFAGAGWGLRLALRDLRREVYEARFDLAVWACVFLAAVLILSAIV